ncbi:MAG: amidohydrolase family protein [Candidatus Saganbacteria bacterium]|nr:amidohydrolase family protein [Candidatus Saganbacteria bacterium]
MPIIVFDPHVHGYPIRERKLIEAAMRMLFDPRVSIPNKYDHLKDQVDQSVDGPKGLLVEMDGAQEFDIQIRHAVLLPVSRNVQGVKWLNDLTMQAVHDANRENFRLSAFATFHPSFIADGNDWQGMILGLMEIGFKGIKLHSLTQMFNPLGPEAQKLYGFCERYGIPILFDTYHHPIGFPVPHEMGFHEENSTNVDTLLAIRALFPRLKMIAAHMGSGGRPEDALRLLGMDGLPIIRDTSIELNRYPDSEAKYMLEQEPNNYWYGSDYPAQRMVESVRKILRLGLLPEIQEKILFRNAEQFFGVQVS